MLLFCDSFDHYASNGQAGKWDGNVQIVSAGGRNGTNAAHHSATGQVFKTIGGTHQTLIIGAAVMWTTLGASTFLSLYDGATTQVELRVTSAGELSFTRNATVIEITSGLGLLANAYYYIEWKVTIDNTAGAYEVRVNGVTKLSGSSVDTQNTANAYASLLRLSSSVNNTRWDDLYICNTAGAVNNDFLGDVRVAIVRPDGAGNYTQWTPSAGSNYQNVDDATQNADTDYNSEGTAGEKDTYTFGALGVTGAVKGVQLLGLIRKDDAGSRTTRLMTRISGNDYFGSNYTNLDTYVFDRKIWETSPDTSAAWTVTEIDGAEFGVELVS